MTKPQLVLLIQSHVQEEIAYLRRRAAELAAAPDHDDFPRDYYRGKRSAYDRVAGWLEAFLLPDLIAAIERADKDGEPAAPSP